MQEMREKIMVEVHLDPIIRIRKIRSEEEPTALETFGVHGHPSKKKVMTSGMQSKFGERAKTIAWLILDHLQTVVLKAGPQDYLQEFEITVEEKTERLWVIDDGEVVTLLLPEEY